MKNIEFITINEDPLKRCYSYSFYYCGIKNLTLRRPNVLGVRCVHPFCEFHKRCIKKLIIPKFPRYSICGVYFFIVLEQLLSLSRESRKTLRVANSGVTGAWEISNFVGWPWNGSCQYCACTSFDWTPGR